MLTTILTTLATKLPLAALERWLTHLEKSADSSNVRLIEILKELLETKKLQTQIVMAEQNKWYTAMIRPAFAWPLIIYWSKILVWDKVLGWGVTDRLDPFTEGVAGSIIAAYFIGRVFEKQDIRNKAASLLSNLKGDK